MQCAYAEGSIRPSRQGFNHEEVITVYIQGMKMGFCNIKDIYRYCCKHLPSGFKNDRAMRGLSPVLLAYLRYEKWLAILYN